MAKLDDKRRTALRTRLAHRKAAREVIRAAITHITGESLR